MKEPFVIGLYGYSNSGKTSLLVDLIKHFKSKNFKVSSVKITDKKIGFDTPGKDSYKYGNAGSDLVVLSSSIETGFLIKEKNSINEIVSKIKKLDDFDIIFIEGANDKKTPKIRLGDIEERENTIHSYYGDFLRLVNVITEHLNKRIEKNE